MTAIHIQRPRIAQPIGRVSLDTSLGMAAGLTGLWIFNGANPLNLVTGEEIVSAASEAVGTDGVAIRTASDADYVQLAASSLSVLPASSLVSVAIWKRKIDATYRASRFLSDGSNNRFIMQIYSDAQLYFNFGLLSQAVASGSWGDDRIVMTSDGVTLSLYQNGVLRKTGAPGVYSNAAGTGLYLGDYNTADHADRDDFYTLAIWDRPLIDEEIVNWTENPFRLVRPAESPRFFASSGGSSQDLAATGSATATGTATPAAQVALAGVGVSLASGSATLAASGPLAASGGSTASGTAAQTISIAMSALGLTVASGAAALSSSTSGSLAASGAATAGGSAATVANVTISASGLAQAAAQAGLAASVLMAGAGAAAAFGNAALALQLQAAAQGAAQAGGSATLQGSTAGQLSAGGQATASGSAALVLDVRLQAAGGAQAGGSGALSAGDAATISGSGGATSGGSGALSALVTLTGAGFVQAMGAGYLVVQVPLSATGGAIAAGGASLSELPDMLPRVASPYRTWRVRTHNRTLRIRA